MKPYVGSNITDGNGVHVSVNRTSVLEEQLHQYFNQDFSERLADDKQELSRDDHRFLELADKSVHMVDGHYVLDLPFKDDSVTMPNNRSQAEQRVPMLGKKFTKTGCTILRRTSFV
jgi:hypothetical protein